MVVVIVCDPVGLWVNVGVDDIVAVGVQLGVGLTVEVYVPVGDQVGVKVGVLV